MAQLGSLGKNIPVPGLEKSDPRTNFSWMFLGYQSPTQDFAPQHCFAFTNGFSVEAGLLDNARANVMRLGTLQVFQTTHIGRQAQLPCVSGCAKCRACPSIALCVCNLGQARRSLCCMPCSANGRSETWSSAQC